MIAALGDLVRLLRGAGVRISTAELLDAARALDAVGLGEPTEVKAALATTLVKTASDRARFDELFPLFFQRDRLAQALAEVAARLAAAGVPEAELAALLARIGDGAAQLSSLARAALGLAEPDLGELAARAGLVGDLGGLTSPLQVGFYSYRLNEALGLDGVERELAGLLLRVGAGGAGRGPGGGAVDLAAVAHGLVDPLREGVRRFVERELAKRSAARRDAELGQVLARKPLAHLSPVEVAELRREVTRLAELLRARVTLVPRRRQRGRLDLRRTLRHSLATDGIPFAIYQREKQRKKPRLVVLCDISDSVRNVSRFMLDFVYTLQALFDRVYSFAFVAELGELTDLFHRNTIDRAVELAASGAVVNVFANSNYGRVLGGFVARHLARVNRRTTVLVIGDARTNYHPARADHLAAIRKRAQRVLWLNPEPPAAWGFGDSAMRVYAPHCDEVVVARDLDTLRRVIDELV